MRRSSHFLDFSGFQTYFLIVAKDFAAWFPHQQKTKSAFSFRDGFLRNRQKGQFLVRLPWLPVLLGNRLKESHYRHVAT